MKKIFFLFAIASLAFQGCSKEDKGNEAGRPNAPTSLKGYEEPYMKWGADRTTLKKEFPYEVLADREGAVMFKGKDRVYTYLYMMDTENASNSLQASAAMVYTEHLEEVAKFIFSKYTPVEEKDNLYTCVDLDNNLLVGVQLYSINYLLVMYAPFDFTDMKAMKAQWPTRAKEDDPAVRTLQERLRQVAHR